MIYMFFKCTAKQTAINLLKGQYRLERPKGAGKSKRDEFKEEIVALLRNGSTKKFVADRYKTSQVNLYNWLKKNNLALS